MIRPEATYAFEGRWLTAGPESGRRYVRGLAIALAAVMDPYTSITLFTGRGGARAVGANVARLVVREIPRAPAPIFNGCLMQALLPRRTRAAVYQTFTPPLSRASRLTTIHDLIFVSRPDLFTRQELLYYRLLPALASLAEVIVTVSDHVKAEFLELYPRRDPETVVVVPNGVDEGFFLTEMGAGAAAATARQRLRLVRPYFLAVGRINARKNLARLVRAFLSTGLQRDFDLILAGRADGLEDSELAGLLDANREKGVRLMGYVEDELLAGLYGGSTAACYVSVAEGFGVPPIEAMAARTAVIASDIPAIREVTAGAAQLVDPLSVEAIGEAMTQIAYDDVHRSGLIGRGVARAAQFSWAASAQRMREALALADTART